jgi:hypothetical protein
VALVPGANTFELQAGNGDGWGRPTDVTVEGPPPPKKPPAVVIKDPPSPVGSSTCGITVEVRAEAALVSLSLWRNGVEVKGLRWRQLRKDGGLDVREAQKVPLVPGENRLVATATDAEGESGTSDPELVNYVPQPVRVALRYRERGAAELHTAAEPASQGRLELVGTVTWPDEGDPSLAAAADVQVWVNDFEQKPVALDRARGRERELTVPLFLNRPRNVVRLGFPEAVKLDGPVTVALSCSAPEKLQRLHLVIVGPGLTDPEGLETHWREALGAREGRDAVFRTGAFQQVRLYRLWDPGEQPGAACPPSRLDQTLYEVQRTIATVPVHGAAVPGEVNEVVIVYFRGRVSWPGGRQHMVLGDGSLPPGTGAEGREALDVEVPCERVRRRLHHILGAKLLILDVRDDRDKPGARPGEPAEVGGVDYVWLGEGDEARRRQFLDDWRESLQSLGLLGPAVSHLQRLTRGEPRVKTRSEIPSGYVDIRLR